LKEIRMKNLIVKRAVLVALTCVFSVGLVIAVLNAGSSTPNKDPYIEVGGGKIVYVPRTAQYVKFNGQIRKVVRFDSTLSVGGNDCKCPKCCDGNCYVIVFSDSVAGSNPISPLVVIWLSCA
jgi:hypothetical protein